MTEQQATVLDQFADFDTNDTEHTPHQLALRLIRSTLAADDTTVNQLLTAASLDDLAWVAARVANLVAVILADQHGHTETAAILERLIAEDTETDRT